MRAKKNSMVDFHVQDGQLDGVKLLTPKVFHDHRGYFYEQWQAERYQAHLPSDFFICQSNISLSKHHVLRGLHLQVTQPQAKLIEVLSGDIFDVVVDLRPSSPTFQKWQGFALDAEHHQQLFIPKGCAHGFITLSDTATILYHCDAPYQPALERTIRFDDKTLNIEWPSISPILSDKDQAGMTLQEYLACVC